MTTQARLSLFTNHNETQADRFITVSELADMAACTRIGAKATAPLITPYQSAAKTAGAAQAALYAAVIIDHDHDNKTAADIRVLYGESGLDVCYLAFTTSSHTPEAQRWKVVVPYVDPVEADTAARISTGIAYRLASDPAQARKQQGFYAPNKPSSDSAYQFINELGDPWEWLHAGDNQSPFIQAAEQGWQEYQAALEYKSSQAKPKPRATASEGIVEQIQAAYDLAGLLQQYGYRPKGKGLYLSPYSSSGIAGVKVLERDGKQVVYSHHGPACPLSAENHDGHALDVADVLCALQYAGDFQSMIKEQARDLDPEAQKQRQREYMKERERQQRAEAFNTSTDNLAVLEQSGAPAKQHALTRIVDIGPEPAAPDWILPYFIAEGVVVIAGGHGTGKTTAILPLALAAAGVHSAGYQLAPDHWRHVVYITEDTPQAQRIIAGYGEWLDWPGDQGVPEKIKERLHIVEASRAKAGYVVQAGAFYREHFSRSVTVTGIDGEPRTVELLPLVVIDTLAATIQLDSENDNAEASEAIAALKQRFEGLPVWIIGHVAKSSMGRSEITLRGAGAWEGDANQVLYLVNEKEKGRWLVRGKTRFESPWPELEIITHNSTRKVTNRFGKEEELVLRWGIPTPPWQDRAQRSEQAQAERAERDREALRGEVLDTVAQAFDKGERLNRTALRGRIGGRAQTVASTIDALVTESWLYEVEIPHRERLKGKPSFLVALTEGERAEFMGTGALPEHKLEIPPSWRKQATPEPEQAQGACQ